MSADSTPATVAAPKLVARAAELLDLARAAGVQAARLTLTRRREVEVYAAPPETAHTRTLTVRRLEARVFQGGLSMSISTTDLRAPSVSRTFQEAVALLGSGKTELLDPQWSMPRPPTPTGPFDGLALADPQMTPPNVETCAQACTAYAEAAGEPASLAAHSVAEAVVRTDGTQLAWARTLAHLALHPTDGPLRRQCRHLEQLPTPAAMAETLEELRTLRGAPAVPPPAAPGRLLVHPEAGGVLIDTLVQAPLRTRRVADRLSVTADPWIAGGLGTRPFDADGQATRPTPLIEGGLQRRRWSPAGSVLGDRRLALGGRPLSRLIAETEDAVLVRRWNLARSTIREDKLHLVGAGWRIQGGAATQPLPRLVLSMPVGELFRRLVMVGADPWGFGPVRCPTLVFDGISLGAG